MGQSTMKKGIVFTLLGATCWGLSGVLGEYLLNVSKIDPVWIIANRLFFSGIAMVAILLIKDKHDLVRVFSNKIDILKLLNFSFFGLLICQGTFFLTIKHTNAGMATVIQYIGPVIIMLYYCVIGRRWPLPREVIAIVVSLFGTVLIATHFDFSKLNISTLGLFWGLLSAFGLASYNIFSISLTTKYGVMPIMAWGLLIAGVVVYFTTGSNYVPDNFTLIDFICMSGVVIIGTILSFSLYLEGVRLIGAVTGSIIGCFEPIAAIIFSFLLLGTTFGTIDLIGAAFILSAVIVLSKR
ncbi:DMT family transporter [uncultured Gemella sp.]|uniref:DMT family transporter n=1 Tax=uncultured Gemella sp. TaxID=254352 RepID=UPI0028D3A588|nr:DMT family transporter [uncultured Gemella sp.]